MVFEQLPHNQRSIPMRIHLARCVHARVDLQVVVIWQRRTTGYTHTTDVPAQSGARLRGVWLVLWVEGCLVSCRHTTGTYKGAQNHAAHVLSSSQA